LNDKSEGKKEKTKRRKEAANRPNFRRKRINCAIIAADAATAMSDEAAQNGDHRIKRHGMYKKIS
jgi:hypothetical protein